MPISLVIVWGFAQQDQIGGGVADLLLHRCILNGQSRLVDEASEVNVPDSGGQSDVGEEEFGG